MVKSRSRNPDQHELLSVTDLRAAFQSFAAADSLRLEKAGRYLGWKCRTDGGELLGEAVMRALNGDRRCPRQLPAVQFLIGVMKSLASEIIEKRKSDQLANPTNENPLSPSGLLTCFATELPGPEELLLAKEEEEYLKSVVADIEALFVNDEQARQVLRGEMSGMSAEEIRNHSCMDRSTYNTARRRIRRRIDKNYPRGWNR